MGVYIREYCEGPKVWTCSSCGAHLASQQDHLSDSFHGKCGPAKLFAHAINLRRRAPQQVTLTTGQFVVQYTHCMDCDEYVGWTYIKSHQRIETYKVGKFILEAELISLKKYNNEGFDSHL